MPCPDLKTCVLATAEDHCNHWLSFQVEDRSQGTPFARLREDCAINWLAHFLYDSNVKLIGIQQPVEQTRNVLLDAAQKRKRIDAVQPVQALHNGSEGSECDSSHRPRNPRGLPGNGGSGGETAET